MVFWRLSFLPYLKSFFKRPVYLFWCPIRFLKYLSWQTNRQRRKNIKKPYLYLRGMDMVFWKYWPWGCISMKYITSIGYTMCPGYYWSTSSRVHLGSTMKIRRRKNWKNHIYTLEVLIWFFGNFALKVVFLWSISHQLVTPCALVIANSVSE